MATEVVTKPEKVEEGTPKEYIRCFFTSARLSLEFELKLYDMMNIGEPDFSKKHPLESKWTLWFDNPDGKQKQSQWGQTLRAVYTFDTVEDFWWYVSIFWLHHAVVWYGGISGGMVVLGEPVYSDGAYLIMVV